MYPDAMKVDGTVNRAVLPAIFNPEDLNALSRRCVSRTRYQEVLLLY
jgi:electron transfer flavoprotein beta subunit